MTIKYMKGDLVRDAKNVDIIAHGCNCFCIMGAGIAKQIKLTFPGAYYSDLKTKAGDKDKLGKYTKYQVTDGPLILNCYTQYGINGPKSGEIDVDYDAIQCAMERIKKNYPGKRIAMPLIGAGLAGGSWDIIEKIIEDSLSGEDITIVIWENDIENLEKFNLL